MFHFMNKPEKKEKFIQLQVPYIYTNSSISRKHTATTKHYIRMMFSAKCLCLHRKERKEKKQHRQSIPNFRSHLRREFCFKSCLEFVLCL